MSKERLFRFKQFSVDHTHSAMKVGTDAVMIGAWTELGNAKRILDAGTGSGVIALMMAQRSPVDATVHAVEVSEAEVREARANAKRSPWPEKIVVHHCAIQNFRADVPFDLLISNPPYFLNSSAPPDPGRTRSRHADQLTYDDLLEAACSLTTGHGSLSVILPTAEAELFQDKAAQRGFHPFRKCAFHSRESFPAERFMLQLRRDVVSALYEEKLVLYDEAGGWSEAYRALTKDFYLYA